MNSKTWVFEDLDRCTLLASDAISIFITETATPNHFGGRGSGVIVDYQGLNFLVTAEHVISMIWRNEHKIFNIGPRFLELDGLRFEADYPNDLAACHLTDEWLMSHGIYAVPSIKLEHTEEVWEGESVFLLLGFPGRRTGIDISSGFSTRELRSLSLHDRVPKPRQDCHVFDAVCYSYEPEKMVLTDGSSAAGQDPRLNGMSGGPVIEFCVTLSQGALTAQPRLSGILAEWHPDLSTVVAARSRALKRFLHSLVCPGRREERMER